MQGRARFREDLFFRLNVIALTLPPLRERPAKICCRSPSTISGSSGAAGPPRPLLRPAGGEQAISWYAWPGNLRELRNAVERAVILAPARV